MLFLITRFNKHSLFLSGKCKQLTPQEDHLFNSVLSQFHQNQSLLLQSKRNQNLFQFN